MIWPTYASIVRLDAIYLTTFGRISGVIDTPADDLRTVAVQMDKGYAED